jgi:hypothetical protein
MTKVLHLTNGRKQSQSSNFRFNVKKKPLLQLLHLDEIGIQIMDRTAKSPDLNSIEYL